MSANLLQLVASIAERGVIRYTPAGIPMVNAQLKHSSEQAEAGFKRTVDFEIAALAAGEISGKLNRAELGREMVFNGFLARKTRNAKTLVFHIIDFDIQTI